MARVDFYQLTRDPAPVLVAQLADKALGAGERLIVVAGHRPLRDAISRALWERKPTSFLPHGPVDGPDAAGDPILLADAAVPAPAPNGAGLAVLADGGWADAALTYARAILMFEPAQAEPARAAWRALKAADSAPALHYWRQAEDGTWREGP